MNRSVQLAVILGLSLVSSALYASPPYSGCDDCAQPPHLVSGFKAEAAAKAYAEGTVPSPDQLCGSWINVGEADLASGKFGLKNSYDPDGLKNSDGSPAFSLSFAMRPDFFGNQAIVVSISGLGEKTANEGPNSVTLTNTDACFAQKGSLVEYYNYECRLLVHNRTRMICAIRVMGVHYPDPENAAWSNHIAGYDAYVKQ
jgi:hypothetical protein